jgi:hypothetical protein
MYLPNMWENDYDYQWTLISTYHYYGTSFYKAKKNQHDLEQRKYKGISHRYLAHEGENPQGNVVMYHHCDIYHRANK